MIPLLQPLFRGDWAAYAEPLVCAPPPADAIPLARLLDDGDLLDDILARQARRRGVVGPDRRAVASAWAMDYLWALLPGAAAAASVLQHCFPLAPDEVSLRCDADGTPLTFYLPHEGHALPGSETLTRYGPLLHRHLAPLFDALAARARLPRKIAWGSAARYLEGILDQALGQIGPLPQLLADRALLLAQPMWPDGARNPMHARQRSVPCPNGGPAPFTLHRQCCLYYLLPGEGYCGACPLAGLQTR
ncbi:ferric iron reductase FhuF [Chitiniphilus shinanonensis]|uniref:Ferric iron reductase FhuF n=1 Tax=Chitiniphilus shinanonensis TaxID=553088 RepID=A0ABQ6BXC1_9NEIS|nr:siderophore-iron reductase FhuF [Chitiniphilus shinanonensis]GLS06336.1 ferric iron reductase FhuF [Chitiniphilus shinanonensis]